MDGKTLQEIRENLLSRWQRIDRDLGGSAIVDVDEESHSAEIIDIAQCLEQQGRETSLKEQERRELLAVERAIAKLATGNFGVCEDCGEDIPPRRLLVVPEARLCAACQTFEERQNARVRA